MYDLGYSDITDSWYITKDKTPIAEVTDTIREIKADTRAEAINEVKMLFKLAVSEKPNRTLNEVEAVIIFRNIEKGLKEQK